MPSLSQQLCETLLTRSFASLPATAIEAAKRLLLDVIGVGLIGSRQEMAQRALRAARELDAPAAGCGSTAWGTSQQLPVTQAALVNGIASHVLDFDDTHTDAITHGSAVLAPTVLALGERLQSSGKDLLRALVIGWEVTARVGLAARGSFHRRGFHTTSIAGVYGAAAASAVLLDLDPARASHALGLAGSQVSGVSEYLSNGSSAKAFHPGWAAASGIVAAHLAKQGMTGPMTIFEGRYGLFKTYGIEAESELSRLNERLGEAWQVEQVSIKPYPCCHFAHAFIDCALALRAKGVIVQGIESIEALVPEIELPLICEPWPQKLRPDSAYAAKFSLPYLVAAALTDGNIDHQSFTSQSIARPAVLELAQRVSYRTARAGETTFPKYFPGRLRVGLNDGTQLEERLDVNVGNPDNPLPASRLEAKFRDNALEARLPRAQVDSLLERVSALERHDAAALARMLRAHAD